MIFASVGSLLPFERLVRAVDDWARDNPGEEVFIQIGDTVFEPQHAPFVRIMPMTEYRDRLRDCDLLVAHVGMGSILQALQMRKQMILLPRLRERQEHTTDHQVDTANRFANVKGIRIADDEATLQREMSLMLRQPLEISDAICEDASPELLNHVQAFLAEISPRRR